MKTCREGHNYEPGNGCPVCRRRRRKLADLRYNRSIRGGLRRERYERTDKGLSRKRKYEASPQGMLTRDAYERSDGRRASRVRTVVERLAAQAADPLASEYMNPRTYLAYFEPD